MTEEKKKQYVITQPDGNGTLVYYLCEDVGDDVKEDVVKKNPRENLKIKKRINNIGMPSGGEISALHFKGCVGIAESTIRGMVMPDEYCDVVFIRMEEGEKLPDASNS